MKTDLPDFILKFGIARKVLFCFCVRPDRGWRIAGTKVIITAGMQIPTRGKPGGGPP